MTDKVNVQKISDVLESDPRLICDELVGWLVGFGFNGLLRQYFSLYRAVSQREGERGNEG